MQGRRRCSKWMSICSQAAAATVAFKLQDLAWRRHISGMGPALTTMAEELNPTASLDYDLHSEEHATPVVLAGGQQETRVLLAPRESQHAARVPVQRCLGRPLVAQVPQLQHSKTQGYGFGFRGLGWQITAGVTPALLGRRCRTELPAEGNGEAMGVTRCMQHLPKWRLVASCSRQTVQQARCSRACETQMGACTQQGFLGYFTVNYSCRQM
jgi:hypothetical protein